MDRSFHRNKFNLYSLVSNVWSIFSIYFNTEPFDACVFKIYALCASSRGRIFTKFLIGEENQFGVTVVPRLAGVLPGFFTIFARADALPTYNGVIRVR